MTSYASEKAFLTQQLKNQKTALAHFKKSKDQFYKENPTIDLDGSQDCIDDYYLLLADKIKEEIASIRTQIEDA